MGGNMAWLGHKQQQGASAVVGAALGRCNEARMTLSRLRDASLILLCPAEFMAPELYEEKYNEKVDVYRQGAQANAAFCSSLRRGVDSMAHSCSSAAFSSRTTARAKASG